MRPICSLPGRTVIDMVAFELPFMLFFGFLCLLGFFASLAVLLLLVFGRDRRG